MKVGNIHCGAAILLSVFLQLRSVVAETIYIVYRPGLNVSSLLDHIRKNGPSPKWKSIHEVVARYGYRRSGEFPPGVWVQLTTLLFGDARSWGHVAVILPEEASRKNRVFGWQADHQAVELAAKILGKSLVDVTADFFFAHMEGENPIVRGTFAADDDWAFSNEYPDSAALRAIPIELSGRELERVQANMNVLSQSGSNYQLSPLRGEAYRSHSYNCVTALFVLFRGTGVDLSFVPRSGILSEFVKQADRFSVPWEYRNCVGLLAE